MASSLFRRMPILLILVLGISVLFLAFTYDHQKKVLLDTYEMLYSQNENQLDALVRTGIELGKKDLWNELNSSLEEARKSEKVDFYILQSRGHVLWFGEKNSDIDRVDVPYPAGSELMRTPLVSFRSIKIGRDEQLTVGLDRDFDKYFAAHKRRLFLSMLQEAIYTLLIVVIVGFYSLKDIMLMVQEVKRGKKGQLSSIRANSSESELFGYSDFFVGGVASAV